MTKDFAARGTMHGAWSPARLLTLLVVLTAVSCKEDANSRKTGADEDAGESGTKETGPPVLFDAPKFKLTDQAGASFGSSDLAGRVWVANFMFTHCMATCPRQTARLEELQKHARGWPDWNRLRLVSITVDPARDTVSRLK
ncbi:MAG TPA: SCO family protein, partial [Planctomycetaceae bacterium]|nr:SCO family protein [Planctomycetaceae bacterium]